MTEPKKPATFAPKPCNCGKSKPARVVAPAPPALVPAEPRA